MTEIQLLTIALAVIIPLSFLIYSNSGITEVKETLRAEIQVSRSEMKADMTEIRSEFTQVIARLDRMEDNVMRLLADVDRRVSKLDSAAH